MNSNHTSHTTIYTESTCRMDLIMLSIGSVVIKYYATISINQLVVSCADPDQRIAA